jgi:hypothetical protein
MMQRLGPDGYSPQMSERVYSTIVERAARVLRGGHSVIVDAVYARPSERTAIEQVAITESVPFTGIWLEAPESVLISRTEQRRKDASDADPEIVSHAARTGHGPHRMVSSRCLRFGVGCKVARDGRVARGYFSDTLGEICTNRLQITPDSSHCSSGYG